MKYAVELNEKQRAGLERYCQRLRESLGELRSVVPVTEETVLLRGAFEIMELLAIAEKPLTDDEDPEEMGYESWRKKYSPE
ncbi:MAG: hypothetical protein ABSD39_22510 [Terriglobales bacterium]|jgi:hypothetical protein